MTEDPNVSTSDERSERPFSGWQSASERRSSGGDRGDRRYGDREGYRGSKRYEDRGGYSDRREDRFGDRKDSRGPSRRWEDRDNDRRPNRYNDRDGYRGSKRYEDRGGRYGDRDERRGGYSDRREDRYSDRGDRRYGDREGYRGSKRYEDRGGYSDRREDRFADVPRGRRDPIVPDSVSEKDLDAESRRRLATLSKENSERVARHLVYAGSMLDVDPELSYEHAQAAYRRASRVDVVREAVGLAAYMTGRYSEALRELRTYRRMTDDYSHVAIEADSERGLGRSEKALAFISEIPLARLDAESKIELALVASGAKADTGDSEGGLAVIEKLAVENFEESLRARVELIRADRLEELGREEEANELRATWEPVLSDEGEVDLYEDESDDADDADAGYSESDGADSDDEPADARYGAENDESRYDAESDDVQYDAEVHDDQYEAEPDDAPFDRERGEAGNGSESDESEEPKDSEAGRDSEAGEVLEDGNGFGARENSEAGRDSEAGEDCKAEKDSEAAEIPRAEGRFASGGSPEDKGRFETVESREDVESGESVESREGKARPEKEIDSEGGDAR